MNRFTRTVAFGSALALGAFGTAGCDFTDGYDQDPNAATQAPANLILTAGQVGQIFVQEGDLARLAGIFAAQTTGSDRQYARIDRAGLVSDDFNAAWTNIYQETLAQLALAKASFEEANNRVGAGVAEMHMALAFGTAASVFGDIPFSEALQPDIEDPAFDGQAAVYAGVIDMLTNAIAEIGSGVGSADGDIFLGNNLEAAYTLRARYYLHIGDYANALASARNGISSRANSLVAPHGSSLYSDTNIFYVFVEEERGGYLTADGSYAIDLFADGDVRTTGDTRAEYFFDFNRDGATNLPISAGAQLNTTNGAFAIDQDFPIATYEENQLILAEAALLAGGGSAAAVATALDALNAVRASNAAVYGDTIDPFVAGDFASNNALLKEILEEKYLSLIGQIEAWNDVRRTDNFIGVPGKNNGAVPQRFLYPSDELNTNTSAPNPIPLVGAETPVNASINYTGL